VLASDAHDCRHRPPVLDGAYRQMTKEYGEETARALLVETPMAILAGAPLPVGRIAVRKKKWYQRL
jgi:tyrosine-protein phosphatase YwqE